MESSAMIRRIVDYQKTAFDNTFNAMSIFQDQTETIARAFMDQVIWMPEESRKTVDFWMQAYKKGREDFKKAVDETYKSVDEMIKEEPETTKKTKS